MLVFNSPKLFDYIFTHKKVKTLISCYTQWGRDMIRKCKDEYVDIFKSILSLFLSYSLDQHQIPLVAVEAAERYPRLWARILFEVGAAANAAARQRCRCGPRRGGSWSRDSHGEGDSHAMSGVAVADHGTLILFRLPFFHAFDLSLAGFCQPLDRLVFVLLRLLSGLQASLSGPFLAFLHHLCSHFFFLVAHGELQEWLALLLV